MNVFFCDAQSDLVPRTYLHPLAQQYHQRVAGNAHEQLGIRTGRLDNLNCSFESIVLRDDGLWTRTSKNVPTVQSACVVSDR